MLLVYLTIAAIVLVVLVLVVYLVGIAYYLRKADGHLVKLVGGLQAIQGHARPLPDDLATINGALVALRDLLKGTDRHLAGADQVFAREARDGNVL
jgi:hypothetical protein